MKPTRIQRHLMAFIGEHGFDAVPLDDGKVEFTVPAYLGDGLVKVYFTERVATVEQARAVLGY